MNYVISILNPRGLEIQRSICREMGLRLALVVHGKGTATKGMLDLLGIQSRERRIVMTVADTSHTSTLIKEQRRRLYIDAPGNGVTISVPIKSVGGGRTLAFLSKEQELGGMPDINYDYELIVAIANEGCNDMVMDAARVAGAGGGTVLHGKGTGSSNAEKFFRVSIADEKELVLIVSRTAQKAAIMSSILKHAGPGTEAGAIVFSLPVCDVAGFGIAEH